MWYVKNLATKKGVEKKCERFDMDKVITRKRNEIFSTII